MSTPTPAEHHEGLTVVRGSPICREWNGIQYKAGIHGNNVGSKALSMNVATVPPGACAYAHIHVDFEVMLYILEGHVRHIFGDDLEHSIDNTAGDFIFIEPGVPHEVYNVSETEPVIAIVARSDASEWANIIDVPSERRTADGVPPSKTTPASAG